jgi:hypothetical protein
MTRARSCWVTRAESRRTPCRPSDAGPGGISAAGCPSCRAAARNGTCGRRPQLTSGTSTRRTRVKPACLSRNRPTGRNYQCRACGFAAHRGAVGAFNIAMRAIHGEYRRVDPGVKIRVTYLRATPIRAPRSKAENPATPVPLVGVGVMLGLVPVQPQALPTGTPDRKVTAA